MLFCVEVLFLCPLFWFFCLLSLGPRCVTTMTLGSGVHEPSSEEDMVHFGFDELENSEEQPLCLLGRVITTKLFNVFGFLETIKKMIKPTRDFSAKEVGNNLFSFNFKPRQYMQDILDREPWHFEKNLLILKEIERGVQPSTVKFNYVGMWIRLYNLPQFVRSESCIRKIAAHCRKIINIDKKLMEGLGRSVRIKAEINILKPLKQGIKVEQMDNAPVWVPFKYEHLPSFFYLCGSLEHMRKECDLADELGVRIRICMF